MIIAIRSLIVCTPILACMPAYSSTSGKTDSHYINTDTSIVSEPGCTDSKGENVHTLVQAPPASLFSDGESLDSAEQYYKYNKTMLGYALREMPRHWRKSKRKDQQAWKILADEKCGKMGGTIYRSKTASERTRIINCHSNAIIWRIFEISIELYRIENEH